MAASNGGMGGSLIGEIVQVIGPSFEIVNRHSCTSY